MILKFYLYQTYNLTSNAHTDYARRHCVSENEHKSNSNNVNKYVAFKQHNYCYAHLGHANISVGLLVAHLFLNSLVVIKLLAISVTQSHHATIAQTQCLYAYAMKENTKPMGFLINTTQIYKCCVISGVVTISPGGSRDL